MTDVDGVRRRPASTYSRLSSAVSGGSLHGSEVRSLPAAGTLVGDWRWLMAVALYATMAFLLVSSLQNRLPEPGALEEGARAHLRRLLELGPRVGGSPANEVHAVQTILDIVANVTQHVPEFLSVEVDHQVVSGSFDLDLIDGVASQYENVQNVVVRLSPVPASQHSVLVNCHFDSVSNSPGASDDAVSCAVMLQLLEHLSHRSTARRLRHNIIFLFNGAEENMLQAAHGFITQHKWSWSVRVHVNLEACGAGGREVVFQTGPGNSWLVKAFADVAPHPFAHILAQEIFQSGIIPADTDFRIFRDYGKVPGLDMAFYSNGYVYHTPLDNEMQITAGSIQRAAENVHAILVRLATTDDIVDATRQEVSGVVFADFVGLFMYVCPGWLHKLMCCAVVAAVYFTIKSSLLHHGSSLHYLLAGVAIHIFSWICSLITVALVAVFLDYSGHALSWYSHHWVAYCVYAAPALAVILCVQQCLYTCIFPKLASDRGKLEALVYECQRSLLVAPLLASVYLDIYSGFLLLFMLLFSTLIRSLLLEHAFNIRSGSIHVLGYLTSQMVPLILCIYYANTSLELFIPLLGRCGSAVHADLAIAMLMLVSVIACSWHLMSVLILSNKAGILVRFLLLISAVCIIIVTTTRMAPPYNASRPHPRSHRVILQHVQRRFHGVSEDLLAMDSGVVVINMDRNSPASLRGRLPGLESALDLGRQCNTHLYCGVPYYYPIRKIAYNGVYMAGPAPHLETPVRYSFSREQLDDSVFRVFVNITGPDHMTMQVSPCSGVDLVAWSVGSGVPRLRSARFQGRDTYFLYFAYGLRSAAWRLRFDLRISHDMGHSVWAQQH